MYERISSRENNTIKYISKLVSSAKDRKKHKQFILEGFRLCNDAVQNGYKVDILAVSETAKEKLGDSLLSLEKNSVRRIIIPDKLLQNISDTVNSQGVICIVNVPQNNFDVALIKSGRYIALENTQDPSNLGAIARTAEALGIDGIIVSSVGCDVYSPKVQRAGMGALLRLPIITVDDFVGTMGVLKDNGFMVYASVISDFDDVINNVSFEENCVLMIGNEANGLTEQAKEIANSRITIKMDGKAESLNAAAAAAICMWKMVN